MDKETTAAQPVASGIFTQPAHGGEPPQLLGGYCAACNRHYFPRPAHCRGCQQPLPEVPLGALGTIYSCTVVRTKAPLGLPIPYGVGYVDLRDAPLRVFCLLDPAAADQLRVGQQVQLAVGELGHDGRGAPCLRPYFTPVAGA